MQLRLQMELISFWRSRNSGSVSQRGHIFEFGRRSHLNEPKYIWRPGSARTRWGSLQSCPRRPTWIEGRDKEGGEGRREWVKGKRGEGRWKFAKSCIRFWFYLVLLLVCASTDLLCDTPQASDCAAGVQCVTGYSFVRGQWRSWKQFQEGANEKVGKWRCGEWWRDIPLSRTWWLDLEQRMHYLRTRERL